MVTILRYILFPVSLIYGGITFVRNKLYDWGVLKSSSFDVKTILVGNLSAGGTGKTPHIEYLIRLLSDEYRLATLSRGYGRKTQGFILANTHSTASDIGDEPLQFFQKFEQVKVAVSAKRVTGIMELMIQEDPEVILLDDAFQHRQLKAGLSILLMDFNAPFYKDFMLPTGYLREFASGKKRADIILVTKCPQGLSQKEKDTIRMRINAESIPIYFSTIVYGKPVSLFGSSSELLDQSKRIVVVTGIANPAPFHNHMATWKKEITSLTYPDHHPFSPKDVNRIIGVYNQHPDTVILTTEKDAMRLKDFNELAELPLFYLPIEVQLVEEEDEFSHLIHNYVRNN